MKVGLYRQDVGTGLGGSELCIAVLADALSREHDVDLFHHNQLLTADSVLNMFGLDLDKVSVRYLPPLRAGATAFWSHWREARERTERLSKGYDLFVVFTHSIPPRCHARHGIVHVLFPLEERPWNGWGHGPAMRVAKENLARLVRRWMHKRALRSYQRHMANSRYTQSWTRRRWGTTCSVAYPPVLERFKTHPKINRIVAVGRFTSLKSQLHMISAFREMRELHHLGWTFVCAGHLGTKPKDRGYFDEVKTASRNLPCEIRTGLDRSGIRELFATAKLFWLATGFGEDDSRYPERVEHFGIATIEAMAAGVVPLLIDKGAAREVIEHGVTGFLWHTVRELQEYSMILAQDDTLRARMAGAARRRAVDFSLERYLMAFGLDAEQRLGASGR